jgi:hypothetical protein
MDNPETLATLGTHDTGQAIHYGDHIGKQTQMT